MNLDEIKSIVLATLKPYNTAKIGVFGSFARNEQVADSDVDILVEFKDQLDLLEIIGLEQELSEKIGRRVDLVTEKAVHPNIRPYIAKDIVLLSA